MLKLHIFDMDETLIENDCDVSWKEFLVAEGIAPRSALDEAAKFLEEYDRGVMDVAAFCRFQFREFVGRSAEEMRPVCEKHFRVRVLPAIRPKAEAFLGKLLRAGADCVIVTSTADPIARPLAEYLRVGGSYGTPLEIVNGRFTGNLAGGYYAQEGKVKVLKMLCERKHLSPREVAAYGDSINDLPLLSACGCPFAVSPSPALEKAARENKWAILDWRLDKSAN